MRLPLPDNGDRVTLSFLLTPEQAAWLRSHSGRRGLSAFMRKLLQGLMEDERREIEKVRRRLANSPITAGGR